MHPISNIHQYMLAFYEGWLIKLQDYHVQLLSLTISSDNNNEQQYNELIAQVLGHYREYYLEKSKAAKEDAFLVLSPPWLTTFERSMIWISGFKPSLIFSLINNLIPAELSPEQVERIQSLKDDTRRHEKEVETALAQVQVRIAGHTMLNLIRTYGRSEEVDGRRTTSELDDAMEELKVALIMTIDNADCVIGLTVHKVMMLLNPRQIVKLLTASAQYMLTTRALGIQMEAGTSTAT